MISFIETPGKKRAFWGTFPSFLMPTQEGKSIQFMGKPFDPMKKFEGSVSTPIFIYDYNQ